MEKINIFTKDNLIAGKHIVKNRDGNIGIVLVDNKGEKFIQFQYDFDLVSLYEDDLTNHLSMGLSIDAVYEIDNRFNIFVLNKSDDEYFSELLKPIWMRY